MADLKQWLTANGLEELNDVLAAQHVGLDILAELSEEDLRGIGLSLG